MGVALAVTLSGCAGQAGTSGVPSSASADGLGSVTPPQASRGIPPGSSAAISSEEPVPSTVGGGVPPYLDIIGLRARTSDDRLLLDLTLAGDLPTGSPGVGVVAYRFNLDTNGDDQPDYRVGLEWAPGGGYVPVLESIVPPKRLIGPAFPGTASFAGSRIAVTVTLDALGCPSTIGVRGRAEQTRGGATVADDEPGRAAQPTIVTTDCPAS
jgi:hypothetical protein